ncbi:MAG: hypothetical protein ABI983_03460, partial [Acidobacteriota bacterium]
MKLSSPTCCFLALGLSLAFVTAAAAQEPKSAAPAKELSQLLAEKKLDSIAARFADDHDQFVGALAFPGQLMVVWAKTTAPAVVNEKLIRKEYKEVYIDLNSASISDSRHFVTDLGPDGLRAKPDQKLGPSDSNDTGSKSMRFDGNWKAVKMSEADYMKAYA